MSITRRVLFSAAVSLLLICAGALARSVPTAHAAVIPQGGGVEVLSTGPLSEIDISNLGEIQVVDSRVDCSQNTLGVNSAALRVKGGSGVHTAATQAAGTFGCGEFYDYTTVHCGASVGVGVLYNGIAYGPESTSPFSCNSEFDTWDVNYVPVSQTFSGSGTAASPYVVVTRVSLPGSGAVLTEAVTYAAGNTYFTIKAGITGGNPAGARLFIGGEEDPGSNENGYDYRNATDGAVGGFNPWNGPGTQAIECGKPGSGSMSYYIGEVPLMRAAHWVIGKYNAPNDYPAAHSDYPDGTVSTSCHDLGFGLEFTGGAAAVNFTFGSQTP